MKKGRYFVLLASLVSAVFVSGVGWAEQQTLSEHDIYSGYYSREDNYGGMAEATGNSHYVKFYPEDRIIRLYIPFPYSKNVKAAAINAAFDAAAKQSTGSAYIRDEFGVMDTQVVAHLDFFRWIDGQVMYDCGKAMPCKVDFTDDSMTVIKPGIVLEHKIQYSLIDEK